MLNLNKLNFSKILSGVYGIVNPINRKIYVGSSANIKIRMIRHFNTLENNCHHNEHLQAAWNKYHVDFEFVILEININKNDLLKFEQFWIDNTKAADRLFGYNKRLIANSSLGVKDSKETRFKKSAWQIGRTLPESTRLKQSLASKGKPKTLEHRIKLSKANLGKKLSVEQIEKARNTRRLNSNWKHLDGRKCKCQECSNKRNELKRVWRLKQKL